MAFKCVTHLCCGHLCAFRASVVNACHLSQKSRLSCVLLEGRHICCGGGMYIPWMHRACMPTCEVMSFIVTIVSGCPVTQNAVNGMAAACVCLVPWSRRKGSVFTDPVKIAQHFVGYMSHQVSSVMWKWCVCRHSTITLVCVCGLRMRVCSASSNGAPASG